MRACEQSVGEGEVECYKTARAAGVVVSNAQKLFETPPPFMAERRWACLKKFCPASVLPAGSGIRRVKSGRAGVKERRVCVAKDTASSIATLLVHSWHTARLIR